MRVAYPAQMMTGSDESSEAPSAIAWNGTAEDLLARFAGTEALISGVRADPLFAPLEASVTSQARGTGGRVTLAHRGTSGPAALNACDALARVCGAAPVDPAWRRVLDQVGLGARQRPIGCMASVRFDEAGVEIYPAAFVGGLAEHRTRLLSEAFCDAGLDRLSRLVGEIDSAMTCGGSGAYAPGLVGLRGKGARAQARVYTASEFPRLSMRALSGPVAELLRIPDVAGPLDTFAAVAMDAHPDDPWSLVVSFELDDHDDAPGRIKVYVRNPVIGPSDADAHHRVMRLHEALGESSEPYLNLRARLGMSEVSPIEPAFVALGISIDARATTVDTYVFHPSHIARITARGAGATPKTPPSTAGASS